ncbi:putative F-box protein At4g17780 [Nicotiana tabacum]|uniref:F-box protein At4g17780 n=1 Tax=Nicotiana tabacum TaxID=4097 RepID=A0AC58TP60_TOBAC
MATSDNGCRPFPEDLAMEILLRLPVESLLQFKCVGKNWYETITSPSFIKEHMNWSRKNRPPKIMIYDYVGCPSNDDSPLNPNPITLVSVSDAAAVHKNPDYIQEFRESLHSPNFGLAPSFREHRRQFGFVLDLMTNDYKVVSFWTFYENIRNCKVYQPYAAVYSCSKDSWRILQPEHQDIFLFKYCIKTLGTAYLNGAYYRLLKGEICNCSILSFDFENEVFTEIEGPDAPRPFNHWMLKLILVDDSIALLNVVVYDRFEYDI